MKQWARVRIININDPNEFNELLKKVKLMCGTIYFRKREEYEDIKFNAFIEDNFSKIKVTCKLGSKAETYQFDKDENYLIHTLPKDAVAQMSHIYKIQRTADIMKIDPKDIESAIPVLYKNEKYDGVAVKCWEYDLVEAYAQMLRRPLPDLNTYRKDSKVNEGEVGFYAYGGELKATFRVGAYCQYVFKLMPSPYVGWVNKLFQRTKDADSKEAKTEIKSLYRFAIGDLQNLNPFWRCIIVERCNQLVKSYQDENTVYMNTDSIVSCVRRLDIESDTNYQWKVKREGEIFKWQSGKMNYQWNLEIPVYKGPNKRYIESYNRTHKEPWDILKNELPETCDHLWELDKEKLRIRRTKQ